MRDPIHDEAIELLLDSMSQDRDKDLRHSFFFGRPGAPHWEKNLGTEVYYRSNKLTRAALYIRERGPSYLSYLAIVDIRSMLQCFVEENYGYLASDVFFQRFTGSYANQVSQSAKAGFSNRLAASKIFQPANVLTLFPLVPVRVETDFDAEPFFLIAPASLEGDRLPSETDPRLIVADQFPPLAECKGKPESPSSWLGIRSPAVQASEKMKAAILGALALTPLPKHRHMFSGRPMFGGRCTLAERASFSYGQPHTPPLMDDIIVRNQDHDWLNILASKLVSGDRKVRRQIRALEYFYRAWELGPSERFPVLCMTLDAIFGDVDSATQVLIDNTRDTLGTHFEEARIRMLIKIRGDVVHGRAPDVYDSKYYSRYYDSYEADPIYDLEKIVSSSLRMNVFDETLKEQAGLNSQSVASARVGGALPKASSGGSILDNEEQ